MAGEVYQLEDEVLLHKGSDFEDQIDQLVGTNVREQFKGKIECELIKDIAHKFTILEQAGGNKEIIGKYCRQILLAKNVGKYELSLSSFQGQLN